MGGTKARSPQSPLHTCYAHWIYHVYVLFRFTLITLFTTNITDHEMTMPFVNVQCRLNCNSLTTISLLLSLSLIYTQKDVYHPFGHCIYIASIKKIKNLVLAIISVIFTFFEAIMRVNNFINEFPTCTLIVHWANWWGKESFWFSSQYAIILGSPLYSTIFVSYKFTQYPLREGPHFYLLIHCIDL